MIVIIMIIDKGLASWAPDRDPPSNQQILESDLTPHHAKTSKRPFFGIRWKTIEHLACIVDGP